MFEGRERRRRPARAVLTLAVSLAGILVAAFVAMATPAFAAAAPTAPGVAAGYSHTCAIGTAGALSCWGGNYSGQLGDGTTTNRTAPVRVSAAASWTAVEAGTSYTCGVRTDGTQ